MERAEKVTSGNSWFAGPGLGQRPLFSKVFRADPKMRFAVHTHGPLASGFETTTPNEIQEVADLEMGFTPEEIQPGQVPSNSRIWPSLSDPLSWWATKVKRVKPHQPRPSENAEPGPEPEPRHGEVKEAKGLLKVTQATQMVLPAAVGWGGYFVIGQGALYNPAFAFSVFGLHFLGIMSMVVGWYMEAESPRVSCCMQTLGQLLCVACLILSQTPVSNKLK